MSIFSSSYKIIKYERAPQWLKSSFVTGGTQIILQLLGLIVGIYIIRQLSKSEYALYTMANTIMGAIIMLSDGGVTSGVMAEGGKVWQDKKKLGAVLETGLSMRRKFGFIFGITAVPILFYLLYSNGASTVNASLLILGVMISFYASLSDSLLEIIPKLHQNINPLQRNALMVNVLRFVLSIICLFFLPYAFIAVIISGITRLIGNIKLKKLSQDFIEPNANIDPDVRKNIYNIVKRILPSAIYYCISGQINIWLMSIFGTEAGIAEVGALSRLAAILNLFGSVFNIIYVPRFARSPNQKDIILRKFLLATTVSAIFFVFFILFCYIFSNQALWLLGSKYSDLKTEFFLSITGSCLAMLGGVVMNLSIAKGWVTNPILSIGFNIIALIIAIIIFDTKTVSGVLLINILTALVSFIVLFVYGLMKISKLPSFLQT